MKARQIFDWDKVPDPDQDALDTWLNSTDADSRQFPLQIALQVTDELNDVLMGDTVLTPIEMAEIRGGLKTLRRFAQVYDRTIRSPGHA